VSDLAEVTSPPYDVIEHEAEDQLLASDPHNVVRLILPRHDPGNPGAAYADAAATLRAWQDERILLPDAEPALYVYEQSRPGGPVMQRGLIGALRLAPLGAGPVLPHEDVVPGPVRGRRQLMEATGANLEPIFLLYDGAGASAATELAARVAGERAPLLNVDTGDGTRHRLWAVTSPAEHARVASDLAGRQALIADGHHRYAAYLQLQARKRANGAGGGPWDFGLAMLVDSDEFPPSIGAIHRVVTGLDLAEAVRRAKEAFTVRSLPGPGSPAAAAAALREVSADGPAFLVTGGGEAHLLTHPDPAAVAAAMPDRSPGWRRLSAAVMQELLLRTLWEVEDASDRVEIHHDAGGALRSAAAPGGGVAVICPPLSAAEVRQVAARGERVPRKSTSFAPKPRTGLVMRSFALG
jgi:uncharacterized protein (DUF1015 family)